VLDIFRVAPEASPAPIAGLIELGETFGFPASTTRATVSRLTAAGLLESDARGWYRPAVHTDPFRAAVESWRQGEDRVRPWAGDWIAVEPGPWSRRAEQRRTERALRYLGFRPALARSWLRPDNVALSRPAVLERLTAFGGSQLGELFTARDFSAERVDRWRTALWEVPRLEADYRRALACVDRCLSRVDELPLERALVETFVHGGEAIRVLALDPLLPAELVDVELRARLFERMSDYDRAGRARWHERFRIGSFAAREALQ
jgi:DNA-binding transcriptional regulator PaaX